MKKLLAALLLLGAGLSLAATPPPGATTGANNNWTGDQTFSGSAFFQGGTAFSPANTRTNIFSDGTSAGFDLIDHTWTANQRRAAILLSAGSINMVFINDDVTAAAGWITVFGDATGVTAMSLGSGPATVVTVSGTLMALSGAMPMMGVTGAVLNSPHVVQGTVALVSGTATVTLTGTAVYTSASSYMCSTNDAAGSVVSSSQNIDGTQFRVFGTGTDTIAFTCAGN